MGLCLTSSAWLSETLRVCFFSIQGFDQTLHPMECYGVIGNNFEALSRISRVEVIDPLQDICSHPTDRAELQRQATISEPHLGYSPYRLCIQRHS